jgi:hypothetical protein
MPKTNRGWGVLATVLLIAGFVAGALGLGVPAVLMTAAGVLVAGTLIIEDIKEG